uniref:J domain-containing protein n=1 Tax=Pyramimonas obovata TaxID=1411642 RepID=A0A7S0RXV0_9CHLO|mmetsp:Transcript_8086/g.16600  ORF Transcript_8086/g.16600 Transcript_8086/m.16600 type:complete len:324 (+) Transcript_8086:226-1197(+)
MDTCYTLWSTTPRASQHLHISEVRQNVHWVKPIRTMRAVLTVASLPGRMGGDARTTRHTEILGRRTTSTPTKLLRTKRRVSSISAVAMEFEMDKEAAQALNEVCNRAIKVMLENDAEGAEELDDELEEQRRMVVEYEQDYDCARFLAVVQGFLNHLVLEEVGSLSGVYEKAFTKIANLVDGSDWKLDVLGAPEVPEQPQFSTWEEVNKELEEKAFNKAFNIEAEEKSDSDTIDTSDFYKLLQTPRDATPKELRQSYRRLALSWHPDVNKAPNAQQVFVLISRAYEILSDPQLRKQYDQFGGTENPPVCYEFELHGCLVVALLH